MPKPTCSITLTLEVDVAQRIGELADEKRTYCSTIARELLLQRLTLLERGWKLEDEALGTMLEAIAALKIDGKEQIRQTLKDILVLRDRKRGSNGRSGRV